MHLQIWCQYRCTELEICFGQRRCYSLESKPSTWISVGGERRKTSGQPSRREQFCGNALVARARLVLGQKRKARGFPSVPKGGLQTSETHMIAEKVNQYTCTCRAAFLLMRSMGHNKQKRKRKEKEIKTKKKKKKKQRRVVDGLLWDIGREKHNHHVLGPSSERQEFKRVQVHCIWSRGIRTFLA